MERDNAPTGIEDLLQEMTPEQKQDALIARLRKENERLKRRIFELTYREDMGR